MNTNFGDTKSLIEIKQITQNAVVLEDGSLRQILMVGGVNFALKSEEEQNIIIEAYRSFLNSLEFPIQIVIHSRKINIENYIEKLIERKRIEPFPLLQNQIEEYIEFIRGFVKENAIMTKTFFVIVPFTPVTISQETKKFAQIFPFFSKPNVKTKESKEPDIELKENINQLTQRTNRVIEGLLNAGLDVVLLTDEELLELFYNYYNPETIERSGPKQ